MSSKIPKAVLAALAQKVRESPEKLRKLTFAGTSTSLTAIKTEDLRFDVHKNTQDTNMATGIIQANSEVKNKAPVSTALPSWGRVSVASTWSRLSSATVDKVVPPNEARDEVCWLKPVEKNECQHDLE